MIELQTLTRGKLKKGKLDDLKKAATAWVDVSDPSEKEIKKITKMTKIDEDELHFFVKKRSGIPAHDVDRYSLIVLRIPIQKKRKQKLHISTEPCLVVISTVKKDLITVHKSKYSSFKEIEKYSDQHKLEMFKKGPTGILYSLMLEINDSYTLALNELIEEINTLEEDVLNPKKCSAVMNRLLQLKRSLIYIYRSLEANRQILASINKEAISALDRRQLIKFQTLNAEVNQLIELTGTYRDILNTTTEIALASVSNNMNVTMKKITSWGALILVPSLIAGIFGMNFRYIPASGAQFGFWGALLFMGLSMLVLYAYFQKQDWI